MIVRLLLVEDDANLVTMLRKDLEAAGFAVDIADNGVDAEFMGNEDIYDIIVLDLGLPQRSGLEVLLNWRASHNPVPVLILTARDAWHERVDGFKAGADDYLGKPFHVEELVVRIQALIRRSHDMPGEYVKSGSLTLDLPSSCPKAVPFKCPPVSHWFFSSLRRNSHGVLQALYGRPPG